MVTRTKKIFVGGLSAPTTLEDVKNYFEQFGPCGAGADVSEYALRTFDVPIPVPYVRAFRMQTVSEYQMSHLNTEHNDYAHLKQRPRDACTQRPDIASLVGRYRHAIHAQYA
uniref:SFRICE_038371 n=1 Tax=Spodoptera frugiperda TaxID=7108 RepID=A0A2H1VFV6_SPOFR